jgi:hypothetical protein
MTGELPITRIMNPQVASNNEIETIRELIDWMAGIQPEGTFPQKWHDLNWRASMPGPLMN